MSFLTPGQAQWPTSGRGALVMAIILGNEDGLLAEAPEPEVGRVTGGVQPLQPGTQDRPVVRHYGYKHGGDPHQDDEEDDLDLGLLVLQHGFLSLPCCLV